MTKQELAESMADFIGLDMIMKDTGDRKRWMPGTARMRQFDIGDLEREIFSPDGFFAVWDKLLSEGYHDLEMTAEYHDNEETKFLCTIYQYSALGKDRYTAFYSAVHEMKGNNND